MRKRTGMAPLLGLVLAAALTAPAQAGIYTVYACDTAGRLWDNRSWELEAGAAGITADESCDRSGANIGLNEGGGRTPGGEEAVLAFVSPSSTTIADFRLRKRIIFRNPTPDGTHRYYIVSTLGDTVFEGAGDYDDAVRNALNGQGRWYGYPQANADTGIVSVSRASFPALAGYAGGARSLAVRIGCFRRGSPCDVAADGHLGANVIGAEVDVNDPAAPRDMVVDSSGLLSGGEVNGSDPVTVKVSDPSGIRRLELIDVTNGSAPEVVGTEDYAAGVVTDNGATCSFRFAAPCPGLAYGETIRPTALRAGHRVLTVRATDTAGNAVQSAPKEADVVSPSDRGPLNGTGATETGRVSVKFTTGTHDTRRTIGFNSKAPIAGTLRNDQGKPVAGARVAVLTRDLDDDDAKLRGYVTTDGSGRFKYTATAYASRLYQFGWASHVNDVRYVANGYLTLRARATATLTARPSRPRVGQKVTLSGRLAGKRPRRTIDIIAQGRARGGSYRTFADGHVGKSGRFELTYRFRDGASRGRRFQFRIKIERDTGYAYYGGYSRTATVTVR